MEEIEVTDFDFKLNRGFSPAGKRYDYNTILIFHANGKNLEVGVDPVSYLHLKKMLGLKLTSLEQIMEHSIEKKNEKNGVFDFLTDSFIRPKLEVLFSEIDKVIIDELNIKSPVILGYELEASIYLINKKIISNFDSSEAATMAKLANKKIYILKDIFTKRDNYEQEKENYQKKILIEKEKREDLRRRIYA